MATEHVEIHDLFSDQSISPGPPSDTESMENCVEYRLMMVYAQRRRPLKFKGLSEENHENGDVNTSQTTNKAEETTTTTTIVKKKKKKKKGWRRLPSFFKCVSPQAEEAERPHAMPCGENGENRMFSPEVPQTKVNGQDDSNSELEEVVSRLTEIVDDVPFIPPEIEADAPENADSHSREVEVMLGLLLREAGDKLDAEMLKNANIASELFYDYSFFKTLLNAFLRRMGLRNADPEAPGPQASPKTQIAVSCEVTSRLSAVSTLPMTRMFDHGARYLQDYFSDWARQQGGYEAAFEEDEDEVQ